MTDIEILGALKMLDLLLLLLMGFFYLIYNKKLGRLMIVLLIINFSVEALTFHKIDVFLIGIATITLIPLASSIIFYIIQYPLLRNIERKHGNSDFNIKFDIFGCYRIL